MAMPISQLLTGTTNGTSVGTAVTLDWTQTPFNVSVAVELLAGTGSFGIQYTLDNVNNVATGTALPLEAYPGGTTTVTWFNDANIGTASTVSTTGNYMFPVQALRCVVNTAFTNSTGTFSLQFVVLQGVQW